MNTQNTSSTETDQIVDLEPSNFQIAPKAFRYLIGKDKTSIIVIANSATEAKSILIASIEKDAEVLYDGYSDYIIDTRNIAFVG